jgi:hypothetical protein
MSPKSTLANRKVQIAIWLFCQVDLIANLPSPFLANPKVLIAIWLFCQVDLITNFPSPHCYLAILSSQLNYQFSKSTLLFGYFAKLT